MEKYNKYCSLTFNDILLDNEIEKYMTINVEGRDLYAPELDIIEKVGGDGSFIMGQRYKPRIIKVYFVLMTESNSDKRDKLNKLKLLLNTNEDKKIKFGDEEGYWIGRFYSQENIKYDSVNGVGSFSFYCKNPYLHRGTKTQVGKTITIKSPGDFKLELDNITFNCDGDNFVIKNTSTGQQIKVTNLPAGSKQIFLSKEEILSNRSNVISKLDYTVSTWKKFEIRDGDKITITGSSDTPNTTYMRLMI